MTFYEHFMVGANLVLITGLQRRFGWGLPIIAGVAAASPDWDGLTIVLGSQAYANAHRVWGHNLLVASVMGSALAMVEWRFHLAGRFLRRFVKVGGELPQSANDATISLGPLTMWIAFGIVAALSHLLADLFYSGHGSSNVWPLALLWPFSSQTWAYPILPWGDLGATVICTLEMFALYKWPNRAAALAAVSLLLVVLYVVIRWW